MSCDLLLDLSSDLFLIKGTVTPAVFNIAMQELRRISMFIVDHRIWNYLSFFVEGYGMFNSE
jgi:hypothetical protein